MFSVRKGLSLGIFVAILVLLTVLGLYLWLRPPATVPGPAAIAAASPTPREVKTETRPTPAGEPAAEVEVPVPPTPEPAATGSLCLAGVCTLNLVLPHLNIPINFIDDSPAYDWTVPSAACLAAWDVVVSREKMVWSEITVTLQDELNNAGTPVEFQYPPSADPLHDPAPDAVKAQCVVAAADRSQVACQVQVQSASALPNPNMEIAIMAAALDGLRRVHHEVFTGNLASFYHDNELELFDPVLQVQGEAWQSQCLQVLGSSAAGTTP